MVDLSVFLDGRRSLDPARAFGARVRPRRRDRHARPAHRRDRRGRRGGRRPCRSAGVPRPVGPPMARGVAGPGHLSKDAMQERAVQRYLDGYGLFGSVDRCVDVAARLAAAGVDELACVVDLGAAIQDVLDTLPRPAEVGRRARHDHRPCRHYRGPRAAELVRARTRVQRRRHCAIAVHACSRMSGRIISECVEETRVCSSPPVTYGAQRSIVGSDVALLSPATRGGLCPRTGVAGGAWRARRCWQRPGRIRGVTRATARRGPDPRPAVSGRPGHRGPRGTSRRWSRPRSCHLGSRDRHPSWHQAPRRPPTGRCP